MKLLFDDGGDKIVDFSKIGYSAGKFGVTKIWATDLTGMAGTVVEYNSIEEALSSLAAKGSTYSPIFSKDGIEVAINAPSDYNVILVKKYRMIGDKITEISPAQSMKLDDFKKEWNKYRNTGIETTPTAGWGDNT